MNVLPSIAMVEILQDTPALPLRVCETCDDFGDMRTVGKKVCVAGDESYIGVFLGRNPRLGYVVGILAQTEGFEGFAKVEAFKVHSEMIRRWILREGEEARTI